MQKLKIVFIAVMALAEAGITVPSFADSESLSTQEIKLFTDQSRQFVTSGIIKETEIQAKMNASYENAHFEEWDIWAGVAKNTVVKFYPDQLKASAIGDVQKGVEELYP
jgi:hypothetical protein